MKNHFSIQLGEIYKTQYLFLSRNSIGYIKTTVKPLLISTLDTFEFSNKNVCK